MSDLEITAADLKKRLDAGERILLVDVREPWEYQLCRIEGAVLIPMGTIPANLQKLDTDEPVVCYCHHGMRSMDVTNWLRQQGVPPQNPWPAASTAGPWKSIPKSPAINYCRPFAVCR